MTKFFQHLFLFQICVSIWITHLLVNANPLIGEQVLWAEDREFPFVVSLARAPGNRVGNHFCTGTLISKKHVLTAAHCVDKTKAIANPSMFVVIVGSNDVTKGKKYEVNTSKTFKEWVAEKNIIVSTDADLLHDIAVVTLEDDVMEDIKPAHISNLAYPDIHGKSFVVAGWGNIQYDFVPRYLRKANVKVVRRRNCLQNLKVHRIPATYVFNHLCTIAKPPITFGCGDSGGPLLVNGDEVVGVNVGFCGDDGDPKQQNLHAAVKYYKSFIMDVMEPRSE